MMRVGEGNQALKTEATEDQAAKLKRSVDRASRDNESLDKRDDSLQLTPLRHQ